MTVEQEPRQMTGILVSDFDGTLARHDFFRLVIERLLPAGVPDFWQEYLAGRLTHFEAMRLYYSSILASHEETLALADALELEPNLADWVQRLRQAGWKVIVASAGCAWYIDYLLKKQGVDLEVHANPGRFIAGEGLLMELPTASPFYSPSHGIDKAALVRAAQQSTARVAFAGDGFPDLPAARLVAPELRFATASLALALEQEGLPFRRFERWREVAQMLTDA
jgi:2-hydroxy-3-keto-5-methylthiopentenyl-1-phosphate phosphatase